MKQMIIGYPERVKCNLCEKMIEPKGHRWEYVYLQGDSGELLHPRCHDCAIKEGDLEK